MATPFHDDAVRAKYESYCEHHLSAMLALRERVYAAASAHIASGDLVESLKWGQPSFNIVKPKSGTTLRADINKADGVSLYFTCTSGLVDKFRALYDDELTFVGNRELRLDGADTGAVDHCIAMALTHSAKSH